MNTTFLTIAETGFVILTLVSVGLLLAIIKKSIHRTDWEPKKKTSVFVKIIASVIVWLMFVIFWSASGQMANFENFPFNFMPVIAIPLVIIISVMIFSQNLNEILAKTNPAIFPTLQSFRVFVEILLWMLFVAHVIPKQMTFEGRNFDILVGITGPIIAFFLSRNKISKAALIIWNFVSLAVLLNIVTIAILSTPSPIRVFMDEPSSGIVAVFPNAFLPGFLVPLAYTLHFLSLKQAFSWASNKNLRMNQV
jgi:hypothetical protein